MLHEGRQRDIKRCSQFADSRLGATKLLDNCASCRVRQSVESNVEEVLFVCHMAKYGKSEQLDQWLSFVRGEVIPSLNALVWILAHCCLDRYVVWKSAKESEAEITLPSFPLRFFTSLNSSTTNFGNSRKTVTPKDAKATQAGLFSLDVVLRTQQVPSDFLASAGASAMPSVDLGETNISRIGRRGYLFLPLVWEGALQICGPF